MSCLYNLKEVTPAKCVTVSALNPQDCSTLPRRPRSASGCSEGCSAGSRTELILAARQPPQSVAARRRVLEQQLRAEQHSERRGANQHDDQLGSGVREKVGERLLAFERLEAQCQQFPAALYTLEKSMKEY